MTAFRARPGRQICRSRGRTLCWNWFDPLRDEGKAYADALASADVATRYHHGAGLIHGYFGLGEASETARREARRVRADFKALLNRA